VRQLTIVSVDAVVQAPLYWSIAIKKTACNNPLLITVLVCGKLVEFGTASAESCEWLL